MHRLIRATLALGGLAVAVTACVTTEDYAKSVNGYVGQPIDAVVADMGPPDSSFQNQDGTMVFEWEELTIEHRPRMFSDRTYIETRDGHLVPVQRPSQFGSDVNEITRTCTTRFTTNAARQVQSATFEGDGCRL